MVPLGRVDEADFSQTHLWRLRLASGRQFGPVRRETIEEWLREGRADSEALVSPVESAIWYRVTEAFPESPSPANPIRKGTKGRLMAPPAAPELQSPASVIPAVGLLDCWGDPPEKRRRPRLRAIERLHNETLKALEIESAQANGLLRLRGSRLVWLEDTRQLQAVDDLEAEAATVTAWTGPQGGEFYCIIPWSRLGRLPHEFLSILPGRLPAPVGLRRATEDDFAGGCWIGITGDDRDVLALAAGSSHENLAGGTTWDWYSANRIYHMVLVWGVQGIPLGPEKFAHLAQTAIRPEPGAPTGLRWYLERQSAFWRYARRLNLPGTSGSPVLFASCGARLLTRAADHFRESPVA